MPKLTAKLILKNEIPNTDEVAKNTLGSAAS